ncbi:hypothetical protein AOR13_2874 [Alteromonas stellipolaris LMG 21856]|nr:hypothetical protein AOR13_2874 [Alteromonas stellipolaris LMG 21856]
MMLPRLAYPRNEKAIVSKLGRNDTLLIVAQQWEARRI